MSRVIALSLLSPVLIGLLCIACKPAPAADAPRPNVLVVFVDDLGWGDVACYGGAGVPTPSMDRFAAEGTRFAQFYTASPICSASRCGLLTGQFPARWRITSYLQTKAGNRACEQADFLDPRAPSYVRTFKAAGYATAHVGKWHLGGGRDVTDAPKFAAYGYDVGYGTYESSEPAALLGLKSVPWSEQIEPQQVPRHDRTRWMVDAALGFAGQHGSQPWLINLWLDDVHTPFRPSDEARSTAGEGTGTLEYRAVLRETDRQIGRLLDGLRAMKAEANTIVVLAGDNGPQPSFERKRTAGLRGMKWSLYEGGIRTPLIVRWPGAVPAGHVNETTVIAAVDLFPTLCSLASVPAPDGIDFDGEDLSSVLRGRPRLRTRPLFWEYGRKLAPQASQGLRRFPYPNEPDSKSPNVAVREGDWKLLINADGSGAELYNLASDQNETRNLAAEQPEVLKRLTALAVAWRRSLP
ncbi:MAG TPA: sulfatase-like hydrolase/transferase [Pirellulales bacterium]|nr:sulfatase-like hydrolase/transferase [Pirellulales bacterium]